MKYENYGLVNKFAHATQVALRLHHVGRTGLLDLQDFRELQNLEQQGWKIYRNRSAETRILSRDGDTIVIDPVNQDITVRSPQKEDINTPQE